MSEYNTMKFYINGFIKQIEEAITIGESAKITPPSHPINNVIVSGLGGSGIGGALVSTLTASELKVPMNFNSDYFLPEYVNKNTLLIISSYSGNTEETVNALKLGIEKNAKIICVTSNGKIKETATKHGFDNILIPGGMPPRTCLNLSFTQQLFILNKLGLISDNLIFQLKETISHLRNHDSSIKNQALSIAKKLTGKIPVIYGETRMAPIAIRFRQQINENAKMLCWHNVIPEMNHNELVGWKNVNGDLALVLLKNDDDYYRNIRRMEIVKEIASNYASEIVTIHSKGKNFVEKALYTIYLNDWISYYLAEENGSDSIEVNAIDYLKNELSKI